LPLGDPELLANTRFELSDRVTDAPDAVEIEVGEIPPHVGRIGARRRCQLLGADHVLRGSQVFEESEVPGKTYHRGLWDFIHKLTINLRGVLGIPASGAAI